MISVSVVEGRLARDAVCQNFPDSGKVVFSFAIACERNYIDERIEKKPVDFINVVVWSKGEKAFEYLRSKLFRGAHIIVYGRIQKRKTNNGTWWEEIVAREISFVANKYIISPEDKGTTEEEAKVKCNYVTLADLEDAQNGDKN